MSKCLGGSVGQVHHCIRVRPLTGARPECTVLPHIILHFNHYVRVPSKEYYNSCFSCVHFHLSRYWRMLLWMICSLMSAAHRRRCCASFTFVRRHSQLDVSRDYRKVWWQWTLSISEVTLAGWRTVSRVLWPATEMRNPPALFILLLRPRPIYLYLPPATAAAAAAAARQLSALHAGYDRFYKL